jgi:hypothetical protein
MAKLQEIKAGQTGTGLLVEKDAGYISMSEGKNKTLVESYKKLNESGDGSFHCPYPFIVSAVFQKFGIENANGRIYPEHILKKQVELYQKRINERYAYGELNHPSDSTIDLGRIAMNITELHWEGHTLVGELEIITSKGFRETGICSTFGDQTANLLLNGLKIGVSSRGLGSVETKMGKLIVQDDFELICWDVVSDPSTPGAFISDNINNLRQYVENKESDKSKLLENLTRIDAELL